MKTIAQIKKVSKREGEALETWRSQEDLEIIKSFLYNKNSILQIHIYDKKTKRMFAGAIHSSSYTKEEMLKLDNPSSNYFKQLKEIKNKKND